MASGSSISSNPMSFKHGLSLWCPQSSPLHRTLQSSPSSSIGFKTFFRNHVVAASSSSFANENREYVIVGGGNAAGYAARSFVEHGMADGKLCIVTREVLLCSI
jgi:monodehydroascorbate reductase (NADH)